MSIKNSSTQVELDSKKPEVQIEYGCDSCDYSMSMEEFDRGKGRIMFNDINEGKDYRCGVCDDRVSDPQGMFPNDEEYVEYEVESGYMIDEDTIGKSWTTCFNKSELESAIFEYNRLKYGGEYDFVDLVERTMEGEDCMSSDNIMEWKKEVQIEYGEFD